jgi:hypothetical protein
MHDPMAGVPLCEYCRPLSLAWWAWYLEVRGGGRYLSDWRSPTAPATQDLLDDNIEEGNSLGVFSFSQAFVCVGQLAVVTSTRSSFVSLVDTKPKQRT